MFGNKKKLKDEQKINDEMPAGQDVYTAPDDLEEEIIEPFTANEALNKSLDNPRYELLKKEIFSEINRAVEKGYVHIKFKNYFPLMTLILNT